MERPKVIKWFKIYCWILVTCYALVVAGASTFLIMIPKFSETQEDTIIGLIMSSIYLFIGIVLLIASLIGVLLKPKSWAWVYGIVMICLGMTNACFLPICIPLLLFWIKPESKAYYNSTDDSQITN